MNRADFHNCERCTKPILPDAVGTLVRVEGWAQRSSSPTRRGGQDIVLREVVKPERFLCGGCVHAIRAGVAPLQQSFGEAA